MMVMKLFPTFLPDIEGNAQFRIFAHYFKSEMALPEIPLNKETLEFSLDNPFDIELTRKGYRLMSMRNDLGNYFKGRSTGTMQFIEGDFMKSLGSKPASLRTSKQNRAALWKEKNGQVVYRSKLFGMRLIKRLKALFFLPQVEAFDSFRKFFYPTKDDKVDIDSFFAINLLSRYNDDLYHKGILDVVGKIYGKNTGSQYSANERFAPGFVASRNKSSVAGKKTNSKGEIDDLEAFDNRGEYSRRFIIGF